LGGVVTTAVGVAAVSGLGGVASTAVGCGGLVTGSATAVTAAGGVVGATAVGAVPGSNSMNASSNGSCGCQLETGARAASLNFLTASISPVRGARWAWANISAFSSAVISKGRSLPAA